MFGRPSCGARRPPRPSGGDPPSPRPPSRTARLTFGFGLPRRPEIEDAVAARALAEIVGAQELLEQHRLEPDMTRAAGAVAGPRERGALALADHLVAPVKVRLHPGDDGFALGLLAREL